MTRTTGTVTISWAMLAAIQRTGRWWRIIPHRHSPVRCRDDQGSYCVRCGVAL